MAEHTPRPWEVFYSGTGSHREVWVQQNGIRELFLGTVQDGEWEHDTADAYLIAAAPDLLAAAQQACDWLDCFLRYQEETYSDETQVLADLKAAIAKARGEGADGTR